MRSSTSDKEDRPGAFLEDVWAEEITKSYKELSVVWTPTITAEEVLEGWSVELRRNTPETAIEYYHRVTKERE